MDHIYVDGELAWDVDSTFDMKVGGSTLNLNGITNAKGDGYSYRVDEEKGILVKSQISSGEEKEISTQEIPSRKDFMEMGFSLNLPVEEMSFKPKMQSISLFKKDNALVSQAKMPESKTYSMKLGGFEKTLELSSVSLSCVTSPWSEDQDKASSTAFRYKISGYFENAHIEISRWMCWSYA